MANGIDLLLADHRRVEALFTDFDATGDAALIGQVVDALTAHDDAEHAALYPLVAVVIGDSRLLGRSLAAHSAVKVQIDVVNAREGEPLREAFAELRRLVDEHVKDEERNLLPALTERASESQLQGLGARMLQTKQRVG